MIYENFASLDKRTIQKYQFASDEKLEKLRSMRVGMKIKRILKDVFYHVAVGLTFFSIGSASTIIFLLGGK